MEFIDKILILTPDDLRFECKDKRIDQLSIYDFKGDKPKNGEYIDGMKSFKEADYIIYKSWEGIHILKNRSRVICNNKVIW